jgi:hypothetical protein
MAYISYDHARSATAAPRFAIPRLNWARLGMVATCIGFWMVAGVAVRLIF